MQRYRANRETHETDVSDELPPLAARVTTLQEAVKLSLREGFSEHSVFTFARALKAFEVTRRAILIDRDKGMRDSPLSRPICSSF
jgi:hypothetical protein